MPPTQNQADRTTYGVLLAEATEATMAAQTSGIGPFQDARQAADVVVDFERFLAIGGRHLALVVAPQQANRNGLRQAHRGLAHTLAGLEMERRGDNPWASAGDRLGLAHDVLATHVSPSGHLRSPDAEALTQPGVQGAAFARIVDLVVEPVALAQDLLTTARSVQPPTDPPLSRARSAHLRQRVRAAGRALSASPPLPVAAVGILDALDQLGPTISKLDGVQAAGLDALRVLRQLSYGQSRGEERANAHTLSDLCALGATTCRSAQVLLPLGHTPLERVHRAATLDRLTVAETAWAGLGKRLFPRVRGLAPASVSYRQATVALGHEAPRSLALTDAILGALPRLAADAAMTINALQLRGELVEPGRDPGQLSRRWQQVCYEHAQALAAGFIAVSQTTRAAFDAWGRSPSSANTGHRHPAVPKTPARKFDLGATS